ncbi:MAG: CerR family C-terminal domain-containing protein [Holophaga sp.]|nr:CerR family C-terminal domain-containing protein [Holophaga sp.]
MDPTATPAHPKETRQLLLEAAIFCFAERGYEATTIREIADRAGKLVSLIGYHFGNKEHLYLSCFQYMFTHYPCSQFELVCQDLQTLGSDRDLAAQELRLIVRGMMVDLFTKVGDPQAEAAIKLFMAEMGAPRPFLHDLFRERMSMAPKVLRICLGALQPQLKETEISFLGQGILGQCLIHRLAAGVNALVWQPLPPDEPPEALGDRIADFVLKGLGYPNQP